MTEVRHRYFIAAGAAIILATLTRIEGLYLLIPLALWTFWRWRALKPAADNAQRPSSNFSPPPSGEGQWVRADRLRKHRSDSWTAANPGNRRQESPPTITNWTTDYVTVAKPRRKLLLGVVLCLAIFPMLLLLLNLTWLHGRFGWALFRLDPLMHVRTWLEHFFGHSSPAEAGQPTSAGMSIGRMLWIFLPTLTRGLSPIFALLMFGGIWGWFHLWSRRDNQPLFYTAVVIMGGIWIHLWYGQNICPRYALPIVLMAAPLAALGLLGLVARLSRFAERHRLRCSIDTLAAIVFGLIFAANLTDAMTCNRAYLAGRRTAVDVGRWVAREYHRKVVLVGPIGVTPIAGYYAAESPYQAFECDRKNDFILNMIRNSRADVVLLRPAKELTAERCATLVQSARRLGMAPLRPDAMPTGEPGFIILVRAKRKDLVE